MTSEMQCGATPKKFPPENFRIIRCYICSGSVVEGKTFKYQPETLKSHGYVKLCAKCLEICQNSRSDRHISDLVPEVLLKIFGNFPKDFWIETLQLVCRSWREIIDGTFASTTSIKFQSRDKGRAFTVSSAKFKETCSAGSMRFYLQNSCVHLKKFHFSDVTTSHKLGASTFRAIQNCRNLTELHLDCDLPLYSEHLSCMVLPELQTLTLQQNSTKHIDVENLLILQSSVAGFLTKNRKIANLCLIHFNPGTNSFEAIGHLALKQFKFEKCFARDCTMVEPLFASLKLSSKSLESLSVNGYFGAELGQQPFLSLSEELCLTQKLTTLHLHYGYAPRPFSPELTLFCLKDLLSLTVLHLVCFDMDFVPQLPRNPDRLTAGQLLAPILQNLTELSLHGRFDAIFFKYAFSNSLTKLKKFALRNYTKLNLEKLFNSGCPNLEEFDTCDNFNIEFFTNLHRIVHNCSQISSAASNPGILPMKQLFVKIRFKELSADVLKALELCGVKRVEMKGFSISRTHCF